ncbi:MAG: AraC family transcriptional regulator [Caldimonas sp.]
MKHPGLPGFDAMTRREGYDEGAERSWPANAVVETHEHPFAVKAIVVAGEMWLTEGGTTRHLRPGDRFELARAAPHAERYGAEGATCRAARRHRAE